MTQRYDLIVVGGGHNGLTTAALAGRKGLKVLVLEQNDVLGGMAAGYEFHEGFYSPGLHNHTAQLRKQVVDALKLEMFGLQFYDPEPDVFLPQREGRGILLSTDSERLTAELSEKDFRAYTEYKSYTKKIRPFVSALLNSAPPKLYDLNFSSLVELLKRGVSLRLLGERDMVEFLRIAPMCVADWLNEFFESELLKAGIAAHAVYGTWMGPWSPGSNTNLLVNECMDSRSVVGGPAALIEALEKCAESNGVEIRTGAEVSQIAVVDGAVRGVILKNGDELISERVASSVDPKSTFLRLINIRQLSNKLRERVGSFRTRGTTAKVNFAINGELRFKCRPEQRVEVARISETLDDIEKAFDPVKYGEFASNPALDIHVPSAARPQYAPSGSSVVSVLVHFAPYDLKQGWTDETRKALGEAVLNVIESYAPGFSEQVVGKEILSPLDIEERFGITGGHIHHGEHGLDQFLVRPTPECVHYRTPIKNLFLCGSGSHPGGGITAAPGFLAAQEILK